MTSLIAKLQSDHWSAILFVNDDYDQKTGSVKNKEEQIGETFRDGSAFSILKRKCNSRAIDWMLANYEEKE
jgi:hypothetical protein